MFLLVSCFKYVMQKAQDNFQTLVLLKKYLVAVFGKNYLVLNVDSAICQQLYCTRFHTSVQTCLYTAVKCNFVGALSILSYQDILVAVSSCDHNKCKNQSGCLFDNTTSSCSEDQSCVAFHCVIQQHSPGREQKGVREKQTDSQINYK